MFIGKMFFEESSILYPYVTWKSGFRSKHATKRIVMEYGLCWGLAAKFPATRGIRVRGEPPVLGDFYDLSKK